MINAAFIRHAMTEGNLLKRYIGITDEPLCSEGRFSLNGKKYPKAQIVFVSPMLRCRETAGIIYPDVEHIILEELRECDFGLFENKNYRELSGSPEYQEWIDSGGKKDFPEGEALDTFRKRSAEAFALIVRESLQNHCPDVAVVTHGGVIMNIMEQFAVPEKDFYSWYVENAEGYLVETDENRRITVKCSIH
ncbi:histidine phosphatase family protein [Parasporobacterium paucivorans]|uniref:Alpha-ribazole phosphatase n=1 Tax=Parasporobacterium paucivorans DSM 15970 TaxID=1122934 RepID=A0A1M6KIT2_9FIRM|nr:histidine phosphatase family protein [Parasporobacterium paucivorans]SHJ58825.1 alpha-ribazole phosphatase [Parasporobacterium paucivorans DSM 15970]